MQDLADTLEAMIDLAPYLAMIIVPMVLGIISQDKRRRNQRRIEAGLRYEDMRTYSDR